MGPEVEGKNKTMIRWQVDVETGRRVSKLSFKMGGWHGPLQTGELHRVEDGAPGRGPNSAT